MNSLSLSAQSVISSFIQSLVDVGLSAWSYIQSEPVISAIIGIVIFSVLALGFKIIQYIYIKYLRRKSTEFLSVMSSADSAAVLLHPHPDPDAMSSGLAVSRIADEVGTDATIYYSGQITHHENRAFLAVLDISFTQLNSADEITEDLVVVVDHTEPRGFDGSEDLDPDAIIDHHDTSPTSDPQFVHIETDIGSCATLLTEYLVEQKIVAPDPPETYSPSITETLATGLYYGIKTDTSDFSRGVNPRDYASAKTLYPYTDTDDLFKIGNPKIDMETFEVKAKSFYSLERDGPFGISDVGEVANSDAIPQSADELVQLEGISAIIVMGDVGSQFRISGRTYDDRVHMGMALEKVVKSIPHSSAGGHSRMGGGQISKKALESEGLTLAEIKKRLFDSLKGVDVETETTDEMDDSDADDSDTTSESSIQDAGEDEFIYNSSVER